MTRSPRLSLRPSRQALVLIAALSLATAACGGPEMSRLSDAPEARPVAFSDVTPERWQALSQRRLYFGHQSVGGNIVDGIEAVLADHPEIPLRIVETTELSLTDEPGLYHARIGENGVPATKTEAFASIVGHGAPAVGALKYCYVDVGKDTDPDALFADYQRAMGELKAKNPDLVIVHVTLPLTSIQGRRTWLKNKLRGQVTDRDLNRIRNRYNDLLRKAYVGKEPVFDLARLESTRADGSRSFFKAGGQTIYIMADEYTDDGGHLNAEGQRLAAEEFLAVLAGL